MTEGVAGGDLPWLELALKQIWLDHSPYMINMINMINIPRCHTDRNKFKLSAEALPPFRIYG